MLEGIFERCIDVGHQLQKNVKDNIKESWKNQFFKYNKLLEYFLLKLIKKNPIV